MTTLASRTIAALRADHDRLAGLVAGLTDEQLTGPSGASEWTVAQVLSHLGSGSEITVAGLRAGLGTAPAPGDDFNQGVWARWDALAPREQATGFVEHDETLVAAFEALSDDQLDTLQLDVGFLPFPLPIAAFAGMRLSEVAQHSWDARVAVDPDAELASDAARVLLEHFAGGLGFLIGFLGKPDLIGSRAVVDLAGSGYALVLTDSIAVTAGASDATATFTGEPAATIRLIGGRLTPAHTPADVAVTGNVTLDDLRAVFPGF